MPKEGKQEPPHYFSVHIKLQIIATWHLTYQRVPRFLSIIDYRSELLADLLHLTPYKIAPIWRRR